MQNRAILTVSNRRVRCDCYRIGLAFPRHHGKTDSETQRTLFYMKQADDHFAVTNILQRLNITFMVQNNFTFSRLPRSPRTQTRTPQGELPGMPVNLKLHLLRYLSSILNSDVYPIKHEQGRF